MMMKGSHFPFGAGLLRPAGGSIEARTAAVKLAGHAQRSLVEVQASMKERLVLLALFFVSYAVVLATALLAAF